MPPIRNRRTFSGQRGRPRAATISDQGLPQWGPLPEVAAADKSEREQYEGDFSKFLFECMGYPDLDPGLHHCLARFVSEAPLPQHRDKHYRTHNELVYSKRHGGGKTIEDSERTNDLPYGVNFDGAFLGCVVARRGDGRKKLILIPRGHLKSSVITVAYTVWRILKNPRLRVLIANATASNAFKFVRQIKWQFTHNKHIQRLWPELFLTMEQILRENITWTKNEMCVPRQAEYELGESTVEGIGVGGNLVSRHYDMIISDDLVNNKNVKTPYLIEAVHEWYQLMHSLLEPGGEEIIIGTRWDYLDLYSTLLSQKEHTEVCSIFISTDVGTDDKPFYPKKYSRDRLKEFEKELGPYKYSCQYRNQPVDRETAELNASWLRFYVRPKDAWKDILNFSFAIVDPAFTEEDGDATGILVFSVVSSGEWYVRRVKKLRVGDIPAIIDGIFEVVNEFPDLMTLAIETRGFQRAIAHGLYDEMERRNKFFSVKELKGESNKNKKWRILRLAPLFRAGRIHIEGKNLASVEGGMRDLVHEYLRFPRGHDDLLDCLAYGCDVACAPEADVQPKVRPQGETHKERLRRLAGERLREHSAAMSTKQASPGVVDENLGQEN